MLVDLLLACNTCQAHNDLPKLPSLMHMHALAKTKKCSSS